MTRKSQDPKQENGSIGLPVIQPEPSGRGPRSRMGRWRALVLVLVHVLIIAHLIHWKIAGSTLSPIEPSESIEFSKNGVINAGLIFFAIALASTALLGRWFCGWACHVVALQDGCGWIMKKLGVRPRPFRSRLLVYVPLILAFYMFLWPLFFRFGLAPMDLRMESWLGAENWFVETYRNMFRFFGVMLPQAQMSLWQSQWHITTTEFWRTFPGVAIAIPFLLICGFASVYFLGAKGFCTYGCPYGGFFAPLDELSPVRIRVNDNCEHCGHCTAVCTSNVRVHEEVKIYGMVVDPGCMKCLDCVSACPNDALSIGIGRPALGATPRTDSKAKKPRPDLTGREEIAFGLAFVLILASVRGIYGIIPLLMAVGIAGCLTFMAWKCWRMLRQPNVSFLRRRLRYRGQWQRGGIIMLASTAVLLLVTAHSGLVKLSLRTAEYHDSFILHSVDTVFTPAAAIPDADRERAATALRWYERASSTGRGGIGLLSTWQGMIDQRRAWLHCVRREWDDAASALQVAIDRDGMIDPYVAGLARVRLVQGDTDAIDGVFDAALRADEPMPETLGLFVNYKRGQQQLDDAATALRARHDRLPDDPATTRQLGLLLVETGDGAAAESMLESLLNNDPRQVDVIIGLAGAQLLQGKAATAETTLRSGLEATGPNVALLSQLARLLRSQSRMSEAAAIDAEIRALTTGS